MTRLTLALACASVLPACAPPDAMQVALTASSRALVSVDEVIAPAYEEAAHNALDSSNTREEYEAAMERWNSAEATLRASRVALLSAQDALDYWRDESGTSATFFARLPPLIGTLRDIIRRLPLLGVNVPEEVTTALDLLVALEA